MNPKRKVLSATFRYLLVMVCTIAILPGDTLAAMPSPGSAQAASPQNQAAQIPPDQLDSLVAPIALYPDPMLAQTLAASTYLSERIEPPKSTPRRPYCCPELASLSSYKKTSSTFFPNMRAILKAKSSPGSYLPVSTALMHCRDTPTASARSACDHSFSALKTRSRVFILDTARKRGLALCSTRRSSTLRQAAGLAQGTRIVAGCQQRG